MYGWQSEEVNERKNDSVNEGIDEEELGDQSLHLTIIF